MKIGIIGGGVTGLSAAYDLLANGHDVMVFEASDHTGGLAAGFTDELWDWPLEKFYHHLFTSDKEIIRLVKQIGMSDRLFFERPITSVMYQGRPVAFDSPKAWITYPGFNLPDTIRFGLVSAFLRFTTPWRTLEKYTADGWMRRWYGAKIYEQVWRPLLIGKFGPYYQEANMAWMWARLHVRSPRLGYFQGGFQAFIDRLTEVVQSLGGNIMLNAPVRSVVPQTDGRLRVEGDGQAVEVDFCLATTSPALLAQMAADLPHSYLAQLSELKHMGAVVLTLALSRSLMPESKTYWLNIPAVSPDSFANEIPFLALVEHTNYIDRRHYGGDHLIYCGDYVTPDHPYFDMSKEQLERLFVGALPKINAEFTQEWVRKSWLYRARYAQPVPMVNHSERVPPLQTPMPNLLFASMSQVYPWDRGTNYAVEIGRRAAALIIEGKTNQKRRL